MVSIDDLSRLNFRPNGTRLSLAAQADKREARSDAPDALGPQTQTAVHLRLSVKIVPVNDLGQMANEVIE